MGDENTVLTAADARHFLRRTGFGAKPSDVQELVGQTRGQAADDALSYRINRKRIGGGFDVEKNQAIWFKHLLKPKTSGLQEKLVLFFHDHFSTATGFGRDMSKQNSLIRFYSRQNFKTLVKEMNRDAAMMEWLDTVRNDKFDPNENYSRELLELFTTGTHDLRGNENYGQDDIVQIARAFTGWRSKNSGKAYLEEYLHDYTVEYPGRGAKVVFKDIGGNGPGGVAFDDQGEGEVEIDRVVDRIFEHTDTDGENTVARRLAARLIEYFCHGDYADADTVRPVADQVVASSGFDSNFNIGGLVRAILVHDVFYETAGEVPHSGATRKSVSWPVDYAISVLRLLNVKPRGRYQYIEGGDYLTMMTYTRNMGQSLLEPPSVFGWDWEEAWVTSGTLLARYAFARDVTVARYGSKRGRFDPLEFVDEGLTDAGDVVDAALDTCGVTGLFTATERDVLIDYVTDNSPATPVDMTNEDFVDEKIRGLFALVLQSPAFQLR